MEVRLCLTPSVSGSKPPTNRFQPLSSTPINSALRVPCACMCVCVCLCVYVCALYECANEGQQERESERERARERKYLSDRGCKKYNKIE